MATTMGGGASLSLNNDWGENSATLMRPDIGKNTDVNLSKSVSNVKHVRIGRLGFLGDSDGQKLIDSHDRWLPKNDKENNCWSITVLK